MKDLRSILIVDDEEDIRTIVLLSLSKDGGSTDVSCASGEEAIEMMATFAPDLVMLDVMMQGMDGPTILQ